MKAKEVIDEISKHMDELSKKSPDELSSFMRFSKAVESKGALDRKTKELVELGCAVVQRCEPCIVFHTKKLKELGATEGEILGAAWAAVVMGGGPALIYAMKVLKTLNELK